VILSGRESGSSGSDTQGNEQARDEIEHVILQQTRH
jgi:hypothetical protein